MEARNGYTLYSLNGQRKYLNQQERSRFYKVASQQEEVKRLFFLMLYYTGARISEVLNIEKQHIDKDECVVVIESLKKRRKGIYRVIPIPKEFVCRLFAYCDTNNEIQLWNFSRRTASRYVASVMEKADIAGLQACSKGLRHSFAVCAIENNVPLNLIKKWMGHSSIATTAIYLNVIGQEERFFAKRMWG